MDAHSLTILAIGILVGFVIAKATSSGSNTVRLRDSTPRSPNAAGDLTGEDEARIRTLAASGKKIEAIKQYRLITGAGLKEAKDAVDSMHP